MYQGPNAIKTKLGNLFKNRKSLGYQGLPTLSVTMDAGIVLRKTLDRKMAPDISPENSLLIEPGDIVYNMMRMWQGAVAVCFQKGVVSPAYVVCMPLGDVDSLFIFYFFKTVTILHRLKSYSYGITGDRLRLYYRDFAAVPVSLPPLPEQKKIAKILSVWDEAIEQTRRLIDAKKRRKKSLMQQLLTGKKRLWESTENWNEMSMKELFTRVTRNLSGNPSRVLSITATVGFVDQESKFSRLIAGKNINNYILLKRNEFAYNKGNSINYPQGCIYKLEEYDEGVVPNVYYCFKPASEKCLPDFYKFYFEAGLLNPHLAKVINTGVRNDGLLNLHAEDFFKAPIRVPSLKEQEAIAKILYTATEEIHHLKMKLAALEKQKRGLMQKLLTGEIRVTA